jgi:hypothetical protein
VTRPFGFEGARRLAVADKMLAELADIAQLVIPLTLCMTMIITMSSLLQLMNTSLANTVHTVQTPQHDSRYCRNES